MSSKFKKNAGSGNNKFDLQLVITFISCLSKLLIYCNYIAILLSWSLN